MEILTLPLKLVHLLKSGELDVTVIVVLAVLLTLLLKKQGLNNLSQ
jgi:hypothetical protein